MRISLQTNFFWCFIFFQVEKPDVDSGCKDGAITKDCLIDTANSLLNAFFELCSQMPNPRVVHHYFFDF